MATKVKNKTHGLFWQLLRLTPGYDGRFRDVIKEGTVYEYSNGRTESLSEMYEKYPGDYCRMIDDMKRSLPRETRQDIYRSAANLARRRVIAAVCTWMDKQGFAFPDEKTRTAYAIKAACRACNSSDFNAISESRLTAVYSLFCKKNAVSINNDPVVAQDLCKN
jgi:hypothetical protein